MREKITGRAKPMTDLPQTGLVRLSTILQFVPVSASTWWSGVKAGRFPKPMKLSPRVTVWAVEGIRDVISGRLHFYEPGRNPSFRQEKQNSENPSTDG